MAITPERVVVNGKPIPNSAVPDVAAWSRARTVHVPTGSVFLLGDNAPGSIDSRAFGALPEGQLRARHLLTLGSTGSVVARAGAAIALVLLVFLGAGPAARAVSGARRGAESSVKNRVLL